MKASTLQLVLVATVLLVGCSSEELAAPNSPASAKQVNEPAPPSPAQPAIETTPVDNSPGLAVGNRAPAFELSDQHGHPQSLASILTKGNVALVFYRSADW